MNIAKTLDKEIRDYLSLLRSQQKQTILTVVTAFAEEDGKKMLTDKLFLAEMDKRFSEMEHGKVRTFSFRRGASIVMVIK